MPTEHVCTHLYKVSPWTESTQRIALLCCRNIDHLSTVLLLLPVPANVVLQDDTIGELWWHQCDGDEVSKARRGEDGGGPCTRHWECIRGRDGETELVKLGRKRTGTLRERAKDRDVRNNLSTLSEAYNSCNMYELTVCKKFKRKNKHAVYTYNT